MSDMETGTNGALPNGSATAAAPKVNPGARLDDKSGKALRLEMERLVKGRFRDSVDRAAKGLDMSTAGMQNILKGRSNGSIDTAKKVAKVAKVELATILGDAAAKAVEQTKLKPTGRPKGAKTKRRARPQPAVAASPPAPPPPKPAKADPELTLSVPVEGNRLAALARLRAGNATPVQQMSLAQAYDMLVEQNSKLKDHVLHQLIGL